MNERASTTPEWDMPMAPRVIRSEGLVLRFHCLRPGDAVQGLLPAYEFRIHYENGLEVGHVNLRVGNSRHAELVAGHLGYGVHPPFRGKRVALRACRALVPFVAEVCGEIIITCDPDNPASRRTIELLGAEFLGERAVPLDDPAYEAGRRLKRRYRWVPQPGDSLHEVVGLAQGRAER